MGQNSSQQVPQSPSPERGPSADDLQASQQLHAEGAHDPGGGGGKNTHGQDILPLPSTMEIDPVSSQQTFPSPPQSQSLKARSGKPHQQRRSNASAPSPPCDVEVPDSQRLATPRKANCSPTTPEPTSSFAVPASVQEKQTTISKTGSSRKLRLSDTFLEQDASHDLEDTVTGATKTPQTKRKRRKSYLTPPLTQSSRWADPIAEQETITMDLGSDTAEGATMGKQRAARKRVARRSTKESLPTLSGDGDVRETVHNDFGNMCPPRAKAKLRRLKRSNPSERKHTNPEEDKDHSMDAAVELQLHPELPITPEESDSPSMDAVAETQPHQERSATPEKVESPSMDQVAKEQLRKELPAQQTPDGPGSAQSRRSEPIETLNISKKRKRTKPRNKGSRGQNAGSSLSPARDDIPEVCPKPKRFHKPVETNTPGRRYSRKSIVDTSITAAERELNKSHTLNYPPVLPDSGNFTPDEDEILRRAIMSYQHGNNLDINQLIDLIQWTSPSYHNVQPLKKSEWPSWDREDGESSKEFWDQLRQTEPKLNRSLIAIKGHVQARYHAYKSGGWTKEEDKYLRQLVGEFPNKWKQIALILEDRSPLDIQNRWKDYVQYGNNRNTSRWTLEEERLLLQALTVVIQEDEDQREMAGLPSLAGYSTKDVKWPEVCDRMGNIRSRLQCQGHWRLMKTRDDSANIQPVRKRGRTSHPAQVVEPKSKNRVKLQKVKPSIAQMRWGDKADLVDAVSVCEDVNNEEDIDWDSVDMRMHNSWSKETLQMALRELVALVEDEESFIETVRSVSRYLLEHVSHDELREHYDPHAVDAKKEGKQSKKRKHLSGRDSASVKRTRR